MDAPVEPRSGADEEEEEEDAEWEDWTDAVETQILCLFCQERRASAPLVFEHCNTQHSFDFLKLQKDLSLGYYDCIRVINFIRSEVALNKCWSCELVHESQEELLKHLRAAKHAGFSPLASRPFIKEENRLLEKDLQTDRLESGDFHSNRIAFPWQDDKYLTPFLKDDPLLYSFEEDECDDCEELCIVDREEAIAVLLDGDEISRNSSKDVYIGQNGASQRAHNFVPDIVTDDLVGSLESLNFGHEREADATVLRGEPTKSMDLMLVSKSEAGLTQVSASGTVISGSNLVNGNRSRVDSSSDALQGTFDDNITGHKKHGPNENSGHVPTKNPKNKLKVSFADIAKKEICSINQSYFSSYSTFGIHREMLSDKVRTEAYQKAILNNPSLFEGKVVMDLGCGTGILSLFAAKGGARRVLAVEGSKKMASVAEQVVKVNGYCSDVTQQGGNDERKGVIIVIQGMVEELELIMPIEPGGVDILVSEWMGYCLLFESMLSSVLHVRDRWLKPGGAILPDTAEMYVAGFGQGGTSLPFWKDVYGFDMQCIGKEVVEDAAQSPIVDVVESKDLITEACLIHAFDLITMKADDVDFTSEFELKIRADHCCELHQSNENSCCQSGKKRTCTQSNGEVALVKNAVIWCYGLVVWFDTGFTRRFCRENPVVLSTSPYSPRTHWSQTLLTFREPVALCLSQDSQQHNAPATQLLGTQSSPASILKGRISIARSFRHRSIDISLETAAVGPGGAIRTWPVQMFDI